MIPKSLISELSRGIAGVFYTCYGLLCDVIFAKHDVVPQLVYKHSEPLVAIISDSDENVYILSDIKPYSFEPQTKKVTDSINCEELASASAYVDTEQPPTLGPVHNKSKDDVTFRSFPKILD